MVKQRGKRRLSGRAKITFCHFLLKHTSKIPRRKIRDGKYLLEGRRESKKKLKKKYIIPVSLSNIVRNSH